MWQWKQNKKVFHVFFGLLKWVKSIKHLQILTLIKSKMKNSISQWILQMEIKLDIKAQETINVTFIKSARCLRSLRKAQMKKWTRLKDFKISWVRWTSHHTRIGGTKAFLLVDITLRECCRNQVRNRLLIEERCRVSHRDTSTTSTPAALITTLETTIRTSQNLISRLNKIEKRISWSFN